MNPRIGDAERDRAVECLQEHHAAGRLTGVEFEERMEQALAAKTRSDLDPLFADLPDPQPFLAPTGLAEVAPPAPPAKKGLSRQQIAGISSLLWAAAFIGGFVFGAWWLFAVPVFVMPALFQIFGREDEQRRRGRHDGHRRDDERRELE